MKISGTLMNYYIHCQRQFYLHAQRINLEDNSEDVKIGKALHENKYSGDNNAEISIENIRLDKLTKEYLTEVKKSDADTKASQWQLIYYLYILKQKGILRKGRLEFIQKNKDKQIIIIELTEELENELIDKLKQMENLLINEEVPNVIEKKHCKNCAYFEYCFI